MKDIPLRLRSPDFGKWYHTFKTTGHYNDVIMGAMASQITSLTIVCSIFCSGTDQRKHQSSASLAFVRGIHRWPVNSPHKGPVTRKMFPFDDVIMHCDFLDREDPRNVAKITQFHVACERPEKKSLFLLTSAIHEISVCRPLVTSPCSVQSLTKGKANTGSEAISAKTILTQTMISLLEHAKNPEAPNKYPSVNLLTITSHICVFAINQSEKSTNENCTDLGKTWCKTQ